MNLKKLPACCQSSGSNAANLVVITVGNSLRGDDGVAQMICDGLPPSIVGRICRVDLGCYTGLLGGCLSGHRAAVIVDACFSGTAPGTVQVIDLTALLQSNPPMEIRSGHGFSLFDEIRLSKAVRELPGQICLFAVEVESADDDPGLSNDLKARLPDLSNQLANLLYPMVTGAINHA